MSISTLKTQQTLFKQANSRSKGHELKTYQQQKLQ
jgi:hypothetical protein